MADISKSETVAEKGLHSFKWRPFLVFKKESKIIDEQIFKCLMIKNINGASFDEAPWLYFFDEGKRKSISFQEDFTSCN